LKERLLKALRGRSTSVAHDLNVIDTGVADDTPTFVPVIPPDDGFPG
jgi:hypothetical protein